MKVHARNTAVGGVLVPLAMLIAAAIANAGQSMLGLELDRVSLALFILPFLYGCAEAMKALLKMQGARILDDLFGGASAGPAPPPWTGVPAAPPTAAAPPPTATNAPPPPPPGAGGQQ